MTSVIVSITSQSPFYFPDSEEYLEVLARKSQSLEEETNEIHDIDSNRTVKPLCRKENITSNPDCYPVDQIKKALEIQNSTLSLYFDNNKSSHDDGTGGLTISTRFGVERIASEDGHPIARSGLLHDWRPLCEVKTEYINPRVWPNSDGEPLFIVNPGHGDEGELTQYQQRVRVTTCATDHTAPLVTDHLGLVTRCTQEFTQHKLVALRPEGSELIVDTFSFPSSCSSQYDASLMML